MLILSIDVKKKVTFDKYQTANLLHMSIQNDNEPLYNRAFRALQNTVSLISYWDHDLICRYANPLHLQWFGTAPEDMIDKMHIRDFLGTLFEKRESYILAALQGKQQVFEMLITLPSGEVKKSRGIYIPEIISGKITGFYANIFDIGPLDHTPVKQIPKILRLSNMAEELMYQIEQELRNSLLTGFPGLQELSKQYFISSSSLKRNFRKKYRTTLLDYYRQLQMELAFSYLSEKKYTKGQVANMLNFSNPSNFSIRYNKFLQDRLISGSTPLVIEHNDRSYRTYIKKAPLAIAILDRELKFLTVSDKWLLDHNVKVYELLGTAIDQLEVQPYPFLNKIYLECLRNESHSSDELHFKNKEGKEIRLNWYICPWYDDDKNLGGLLVKTEEIRHTALANDINIE